jgi:hypothetical protein
MLYTPPISSVSYSTLCRSRLITITLSILLTRLSSIKLVVEEKRAETKAQVNIDEITTFSVGEKKTRAI